MNHTIYTISAALMIVGLLFEVDKQSKSDTLILLCLSFVPVFNTIVLLVAVYSIIKED